METTTATTSTTSLTTTTLSASSRKETIRKCLLRYVDNILCLDDIQGVVSLHQLGLLPREDMNSYLDGSKNASHSKKKSKKKGTSSTEDRQVELPGWDFLEGVLSKETEPLPLARGMTLPIQSLCASLTGMAVSGETMSGNHVARPPAAGGPGGMTSMAGMSGMTPMAMMARNATRGGRNTTATTTAAARGGRKAQPKKNNPAPVIPPVNVNARNSDGESALTFALKNEQLEMIQILVEKGKADVNMQNKDGNTELMMAARRGQTKMVRLLVEGLGANVHLRNKEGMTALMVAEKYERTEIVRFLSGAVLAGRRVSNGVGVRRDLGHRHR